MSENINQNNQQLLTTPTPEASGEPGGERTFTQEEVNRIVADRLARERVSVVEDFQETVDQENALKLA